MTAAKPVSDRKFGVEIECVGMTLDKVKELLKTNNIKVSTRTDDYSGWTVKEDGSIRGASIIAEVKCYSCEGKGYVPGRASSQTGCTCRDCVRNSRPAATSTPYPTGNIQCWSCRGRGTFPQNVLKGCEVVSPILSGKDGLKELSTVCKLLKSNGITANASCGLHVHVYAKDYKKNVVLNVFQRYAKYEKTIDKWMSSGRRGNKNSYCFSTTSSHVTDEISLDDMFDSYDDTSISLEEKVTLLYNALVVKKATTRAEKKISNSIVDSYFGIDRHCKINLSAYHEHGTVEFRHHHGSVNDEQIQNWVMFCIQFFEQSMVTPIPEKDSLYLGISKKVKTYYQDILEKEAAKAKPKKKTATKKKAV